jgi:hypothetical protein
MTDFTDLQRVVSWKSNKAMVIGRDHSLFRVNRQDFCDTLDDEGDLYGIVCDGCGSGAYTEVGASLIGNLVLRLLPTLNLQQFNSPFAIQYTNDPELQRMTDISKSQISRFIESQVTTTVYAFIERLTRNLQLYTFIQNKDKIVEKMQFINDYLLTTIIFSIVLRDYVVIGHCGDGVVIVDDDVTVIDQGGSPHYLMYNNVPKEALQSTPSQLQGLKIDIYDTKKISKIAIGTDGLTPLVDNKTTNELFGVSRLQRKFNMWSNQKVFFDDAACVIFEKV